MLTEFTSYDEVRAVLGVSAEELDDDTLVLPLYAFQLEEDLEEVSEGLVDTFRLKSAIAYASRTSAEKRLVRLVNLYSSYAVAKNLLASLPYFAELRITDGRAEKERVADPYQLTRDAVMAGLTSLRLKLEDALAAVDNTFTATGEVTLNYVTSTGLAVDPVTNT